MVRTRPDPSPEPELSKIVGKLGTQQRNLSRMREPIHQIFANWPSDSAGIVEFTKKYGLIYNCVVYGDSDLHLEDGAFAFDSSEWRTKQKYLWRLWDFNGKRDPRGLSELSLLFGNESLDLRDDPNWFLAQHGLETDAPAGSEFLWVQKRSVLTLEIRARSLYRHMCFLVMLAKPGSLRYCENPNCMSPRFRAGRSDHIYCTSDCAELIAKRRWWAENGNEWRKQRKKLGKSKVKRGKR